MPRVATTASPPHHHTASPQDYGMFQVYHQCVHFNDPIAHGHVHWDDMIISPCIKVMLVLDDTSVSAEELVASVWASDASARISKCLTISDRI